MYIFIFVNWDTLVPWVYQLCCLPSINNTIQHKNLEIEVRHFGVQCDLLCPQVTSNSNPEPESPERNFGPVTSTPVKDGIPVVVSDTDISDTDILDINDSDESTTVDATKSTAYHESSISINSLMITFQ